MLDRNRMVENEMNVLASQQWGTIGPRSVEAAKKLASHVDAVYGLVCHSLDGAYESLLRHFGACYGMSVVVGSVCAPMDALLPVCTGAAPLFCAVCDTCGMIIPDALDALLAENDNVACVMADYFEGASCSLEKMYAVCKAHNTALILNAGGNFSAKYNGKPLTACADAVVYSLEAGSAICSGRGGFLASDDREVYAGAYAYHNCGRSFDAGSSLNMDVIVGGDMRSCEWICVAVEEILESGAFADPVPTKQVKMEGQPVFASAYAKKMTGK